MLSVLIPTYNHTCYALCENLHKQLVESGEDYEMIVAEDGSKDQVSIIANHKITELSQCRHIINKQNVGRARIINFLVKEARGEWCVIMDSDAKVVSDDFIKRYISYSRENYDVVVGSLANPKELPSPDATLRYKYEKKAEGYRTTAYRNEHPYERFTTFNFMAKRSILLEVPFDERCIEYGYEDTLMGLELKRRGKTIIHVDNPLIHLGFDSNSVFLGKTETSLHSLKRIEKDMLPYTPLGRSVIKLRKLHFASIVSELFKKTQPMLRSNLLSNNPNLTIFSIYKLGYYLTL